MNLGAVILAAGAGRRLGGAAKALLPRGGGTYLSAIAATARAVGLARAVVVVGPPFGDAVAEHARALGLAVEVNADPGQGMASSIAIGFAALAETDPADALDAAWLWPVDHPEVRAGSLEQLIAALGISEVAQPRFGGRGGHPPLVARSVWPRLAACGSLDGGARAVIAAADVVAVELDDAGLVRDVDTPEDLARAGAGQEPARW